MTRTLARTSTMACALGVLALLVPAACDQSKGDSGGDNDLANIGETEAPADDGAEGNGEGGSDGGTDAGTDGGTAADDGAGACVDDTDCPAGEACREGVCSGGAGDAGETGVTEDDGGGTDDGDTDGGGSDGGGTDDGGTDGGACDPKLDPECAAECLADEDCALGQACVDNRCLG
jgi:hypothetical protein